MKKSFHVDPDIHQAETLAASFYTDPEVFEALKERIFLRSWQWIGHENLVRLSQSVHPFTLLDNYLNEPLLLVRDKGDEIYCLSNVCTHRGNIVVHHPGQASKLVCGYHGRKFELNGKFHFMPEFREAQDFPRPCDDLTRFPVEKWGPFLFTGLNPAFDMAAVIKQMQERVGFSPPTRIHRSAPSQQRLPGQLPLGPLLRQLPGRLPHSLCSCRPKCRSGLWELPDGLIRAHERTNWLCGGRRGGI